jgi:hypothetical protein
MRVPYDEGLASHVGSESCVSTRKGGCEALTGESAGRVLSRENFKPLRGADLLGIWGRRNRAHRYRDDASEPCAVVDPVHAWKQLTRNPGDPTADLRRWTEVRAVNP